MDLNIKNKFLILLFVILISFIILTLVIFQIFIKINNDILKNVVIDLLSQTSKKIENEFKKIKDLSASIMTNPSLQNELINLNNNKKDPLVNGLIDKFNERLSVYSFREKYLKLIYILDPFGYEFSSRQDFPIFDKISKRNIIEIASKNNGGHEWFFSDQIFWPLLSLREIREVKNLSLKKLGTLILSIDIKTIIDSSINISTKYDINLAIFLDNKLVYVTDKNLNVEKLFNNIDSTKKAPKIVKTDKKKYIMTYMKSSDGPWTYICLFPYSQILDKYQLINLIFFIIYLAIFCILALVGIKFTKSLTHPIAKLAKVMKNIENDDFNIDKNEFSKYEKKDEIGILYKEFFAMLKKINTLINENYKKQLIIKDAQYRTLQAQINPHFLYNTLESINWIAKGNKQNSISRMVKALGNLLRISISNKLIFTVKEQLDLLNDYIAIQKIRYEDRLMVQINVENKINKYGIPKLILQPIVENSIKYGLEVLTCVCEIKINIVNYNKNKLKITLNDNGPGMTKSFVNELKKGKVEPKGSGIGLKNIKERLKIIYQDNYTFNIKSKIKEGTEVTIIIPALPINEYENLLIIEELNV